MMQSDEKNLPTEPGWYFAKFSSGLIRSKRIECVQVVGETSLVFLAGNPNVFNTKDFQWFGKVSMPVEID